MGGIWTISIVLLLQYSLFIDESFAQNVEAAFRQFGLSPLVVPVPPSERLDVVYPSGARVDLGNRLTPTQTSQMPVISLPPDAVSDDRLYTLAVFDADYVSSDVPILSGAVQWLVGNIPGQRVEAGETIARYEGPIPLVATGPHRIVFLYYQQPARLAFEELSLLDGYIFVRFLFQAPAFAEKYSLGDPIAGNFFITQFDLGTVKNLVSAVLL